MVAVRLSDKTAPRAVSSQPGVRGCATGRPPAAGVAARVCRRFV